MQGVLRGSSTGRYPHPAHTVLCQGSRDYSLHHLLSCSRLGLDVLGLPGAETGLSWVWGEFRMGLFWVQDKSWIGLS